MGESFITRWINIWLTKQQQELVQKVFGASFNSSRLPIGPNIVMRYGILPPPPSMSAPPAIKPVYGVPMPLGPNTTRLYFTPEQKLAIRQAGGKPCDFADIRPTMHLMYGMPLNMAPPPPGKP